MFKNAFLDNAHLDIETVLMFVNTYLRECFSYAFVKNEFGLGTHNIYDWASFCREVLVEWCCKQEGKIEVKEKSLKLLKANLKKENTTWEV